MPAPAKRPNIVLTIADDQRYSALGCAALDPVNTPALDRLAARGTRFSHAFHFGSPHGAICAPSRAMLHTGTPYFQLPDGAFNCRLRPEGPDMPTTLGEKLRGAGYATFATGKWHNSADSFARSFGAAENVFFGGMADHYFTPVHQYDPIGAYPESAARLAGGHSTEVFAQSAIDYIRSRGRGDDEERPFFCYCAFTAPHDPRTPPDEYRRQYQPAALTLPPNACTLPGPERDFLDLESAMQRDERLVGRPHDGNEIRRNIAEYYGMVAHMDEWIGRIHAAVEEIGELENTIFIHTADHGLAVGQHGLMGKQNLYEHSTRVPLIVAGPGIAQGRVEAALCYQHELHPTLLELAAPDAPRESTEFRSLAPLLQETASASWNGREVICTSFEDRMRTARGPRYKLIEYQLSTGRRTQLFDLQEDPWEMHDLSGEPAYKGTMETLRTPLREWQARNRDPLASVLP